MYTEKEYWRNRLNSYGSINTSKIDYVNEIEQQLLLNHIKEDNCVIDFGVGGGRLFPVYNSIKGLIVQGWDIADFKKIINEKKIEFKYGHLVSDVNIWDAGYPENNFDVVVSFSVLHHIRPENIINTVKELMRIGKKLIVSVYNDKPLPINDETYMFSYNYKELFASYKIIEEKKVGTVSYFVIIK